MANGAPLAGLLAEASIDLHASATGRDDAIRQAGAGLLAARAIDDSYVEAMIDRENSVSTYLGEGVAVPHGTLRAKDAVIADALSLVRFPEGVQWDGHDVRLVIGIAARDGGHIALLAQLATVLLTPGTAAALRTATTVERVYDLLDSAPASIDS